MRTWYCSVVFAAVSTLAIFLITLAGSAQATPSITPLTVVFPSVPVKQTSGPLIVTVVNPDTMPITLASIQLISNDFAQTNN